MIRPAHLAPRRARAAAGLCAAAGLSAALALAGCAPKAAAPSTLSQMKAEVKGSPPPPGAIQKYLSGRSQSSPPSAALNRRPPNGTP